MRTCLWLQAAALAALTKAAAAALEASFAFVTCPYCRELISWWWALAVL